MTGVRLHPDALPLLVCGMTRVPTLQRHALLALHANRHVEPTPTTSEVAAWLGVGQRTARAVLVALAKREAVVETPGHRPRWSLIAMDDLSRRRKAVGS